MWRLNACHFLSSRYQPTERQSLVLVILRVYAIFGQSWPLFILLCPFIIVDIVIAIIVYLTFIMPVWCIHSLEVFSHCPRILPAKERTPSHSRHVSTLVGILQSRQWHSSSSWCLFVVLTVSLFPTPVVSHEFIQISNQFRSFNLHLVIILPPLLQLAFDTIIFLLTFARTAGHIMQSRKMGVHSITEVVLRDG